MKKQAHSALLRERTLTSLRLNSKPGLRARAEITSHFGASAGRADARRRDEVDVGHRRGAATKQMPARRRAPSGCGPQARWLCCSLLTYGPGIARRSRLASGPGGQQQNANLFLRETYALGRSNDFGNDSGARWNDGTLPDFFTLVENKLWPQR